MDPTVTDALVRTLELGHTGRHPVGLRNKLKINIYKYYLKRQEIRCLIEETEKIQLTIGIDRLNSERHIDHYNYIGYISANQ